MQDSKPITRPQRISELFFTFNSLALQGFGGVLAVSERVLVGHKRWMSREQFVETLSLAQVLPGPNVVNLALMVGDRFFGLRGAFVALAGMLVIPLIIVLALTATYVFYAHNPTVTGALKGMAAVSTGLIAGTALRLAPALGKNPMGVGVCVLFVALTFGAVALLRLPQAWVLLGLGLLACCYAAWRIKRSSQANDKGQA